MKKIIALVSAIATIMACFCVGVNATNGINIKDGTEITFKDVITNYGGADTETQTSQDITILYTYGGSQTQGSKIRFTKQTEAKNMIYVQANGGTTIAYKFDTNEWRNQEYKTIVVSGDQTLTDENAIEWLYNNTVSGMPPQTLKNAVDNTKATFATTLTVATAIIAWLMANQLALVGLYMYILVALVATGKRFITGV